MTSTAVAEEAAPPMATDLDALAELRETRFHERAAEINADPTMDSRLKALLLDREALNTRRQAELLGITQQRVSMLRTSRRKPTRARPHPSVFPDKDTVEGMVAGVEDPGIEKGRLIEWALHAERLVWDAATGTLVPHTPDRHGRTRRAVPRSRRKTTS